MNSISDSPKILVVSDVHLGALYSRFELFKLFLAKFRAGDYGTNIKAIILLGDLFDLCTDCCRDISRDYEEIYKNLDIITTKDNIHLFFVLGNHEVPVTGDYDKEFQDRKLDFIDKFREQFKKYRINVHFLTKQHFFQYVILQKDNHLIKLLLLDSKNQIASAPLIKSLVKHEMPMIEDKKFKCLLIHGYQFDTMKFLGNKTKLESCGPIWSLCINSPDKLKEIFNVCWNTIIKPIMEHATNKCALFLQELKKLEVKIKKKFHKDLDDLINNNLEIEQIQKQATFSNYEDEIVKFLFNKHYADTTHVVFGHTHKPKDTIKHQKVNIYITNAGAWQRLKRPSFVEIDLSNLQIVLKRFDISRQMRLKESIHYALYFLILTIKKRLLKRFRYKRKTIMSLTLLGIIDYAKDRKLISDQEHQLILYWWNVPINKLISKKQRKDAVNAIIEFKRITDRVKP